MTIWANIENLLEQGFTIEQIIQYTGYPIETVKKIENNWRSQIKTKSEVNHD